MDSGVKLLWIALGGGLGSVARYLLAGWTQNLTRGTFPVGTLVVNVLGCFVIGLLAVAAADPIRLRPELRVALLVGVLGGFTTFSTFGVETFALANERQYLHAAGNILASVALGLIAVWLGYRLGERLFGV